MALQQALQQQREHEQQVKQAALGNADNIEFGSGIVKLYKAEGKKMNWVEQGVGMLVWWSSKFGDEQRFRCLRVSDMHPILDEELYDNFDENYTCTKTKRGTHFFHTMEFEHDVWGVCFARETRLACSARAPTQRRKSRDVAARTATRTTSQPGKRPRAKTSLPSAASAEPAAAATLDADASGGGVYGARACACA